MARPEEKAASMLHRWWALKTGAQLPGVARKTRPARRPGHTSECRNLVDAERFRMELLREIGRKVNEIQATDLAEGHVRDLNDEINRLTAVLRHWELRILELGGTNYAAAAAASSAAAADAGAVVPGARGRYRYY